MSFPATEWLLDEPQAKLDTSFSNMVVLDNLPIIGPEKMPKLTSMLNKLTSTFGQVKEDGFYMPVDPKTQQTFGYAFIEFDTHEQAKAAATQLHGFKLDKQHTFKANLFDDFEKYGEVPEQYTPPAPKEHQEDENLRWWMLDKDTRDQYATRYADMTDVYWNSVDQGQKPELCAQKKGWTETYIGWSPHGTYLATLHKQGVALWGGPSWKKLMRFTHPGVRLIDFSPKENYLVTVSSQFQDNDDPKDPQTIIVWDIRSGAKLRGFLGDKNVSTWPVFKWSSDDKYFARLGDPAKGLEECISVYETSTMKLLGKKHFEIAGVKDFCWSPSDPIFSCWVPESGNAPARVVLIEVPSRKERAQKNLFNVADCKMHWQSAGDYLCVKVDRHNKTKKATYTSFELFRMRDKGIPIEALEVKETIHAFAWEPKGHRFAVIHGESTTRPDVSFYSIAGKLVLLKTLEKRPANHLFWSPQGSHIVLAGLRNLNGVLEFFNVNEMESMGSDEHLMATDVDWDPSGRFVATSVSFWRHQMENGYNIWSFQGKLLTHTLKEKFYQFLWRPRPPSLLTPQKEAEIRKNLHQISKRIEEEEDKKRKERDMAAKRQREKERTDFQAWLAAKRAQHAQEEAARKQLLGPRNEEADNVVTEEWVEELVDVQEIVLDDD